jgi:endoglycosylceramidase
MKRLFLKVNAAFQRFSKGSRRSSVMRFTCAIACLLFSNILAFPLPEPFVLSTPPISVKSSQFVDAFGRQRIFHGINNVAKGFPWIDPVFRNASYAPFLNSIGVNVVRLGWMWSGFEPEEGQFNMSYYAEVRAAADSLAAHGIYVILDAHQDILSSKFCLYDGFPLWVINKSTPSHAFPWPLRGDCSRPWGENAFSEAAGQAYQDFYDNHAGMRDVFVRFWTVSAQLWSDCNSVLGFEVHVV